MTIEQNIARMLMDRPKWTSDDIAVALDIHPADVRKIIFNATGGSEGVAPAFRLSRAAQAMKEEWRTFWNGSPLPDSEFWVRLAEVALKAAETK